MNETSNWVDDLDNTIAINTATADGRLQAALASSRNIFAQIPGYWIRLVAASKEVTRKLGTKPNLHVYASASDNSQPNFEYRMRVQVNLIAHRSEIAYTDINLLVGQSSMRCHTLHGDAYKLHFGERRVDGFVGLFSEENPLLIMTPEEAARYIIKPMVEQLREYLP